MRRLITLVCLLATTICVPVKSTATATPLPTIDILTFKIERYFDGVNILWKVVHNSQVETYFLQHSVDQLSWETIAEFEPNFGEEVDAQDYFHADLSSGSHYYRLAVRLTTGAEEFSKAVVYHLDYDSNGGTGSSPSVVTFGNTLSLDNDDPDIEVEYEIRDAEGNTVMHLPGVRDVSLKHLQPGIYYIYERQSGDIQRVVKL